MSDDLVKRLSLLADSIELGDKLRWGEDSAALREAKDRIEELEAKLAKALLALGRIELSTDTREQGGIGMATLAELKGEDRCAT